MIRKNNMNARLLIACVALVATLWTMMGCDKTAVGDNPKMPPADQRIDNNKTVIDPNSK